MTDRQQRVVSILSRVVGRPPGELRPELRLKDDLELDSAQSLELLATIEEELEVEISELDAARVETVRDLLELAARDRVDAR